MKRRTPAFQFYAADYLADARVAVLTLEQEGAYIRLLAYCWIEGSIPADQDSLAKLCKWCPADAIAVVAQLFQQSPNDQMRLVHKRLDEEREAQREYREQRSLAGKKSGEVRAKALKSREKVTDVPTAVQQVLDTSSTLQSSSSSSTSASQLTGGLTRNLAEIEKETVINPSIKSKIAVGAGGGAEVSEIAHEIYRHFPVKVHDEKSLEAIQSAFTEVPAETLLAAVKAYAAEVERTNTQNPTWATKWFSQKMWKSYLPLAEESERAEPNPIEHEQNLSAFAPEFYETLNKS